MSRKEDKWKEFTLKASDWSTDPTNYYLDTTGGFYTNSLSSSVARMPRVVNAIPYKSGNDFVWHKRLGFGTSTIYTSGISSFYLTEDTATEYVFASTGATVTSSLPTWASSAS